MTEMQYRGSNKVVVTGATGYMGRALIPMLTARSHSVTAIAREASVPRLPAGCAVPVANVLDGNSWRACLAAGDTLVHLSWVLLIPALPKQKFVEIDRRAALEAIRVAKDAGVSHVVYLSVAHPAPVMKAYIAVRSECEVALTSSGLPATILSPWYVLGPGHRWPYALLPLYRLAMRFRQTREGASRLGLVTLGQITKTLVWAVENPSTAVRILDVPAIRASAQHVS